MLSTDEAPRLLDAFLRILGREPWLKRYRTLRQQVRGNPLMAEFVARHHDLELAMGRWLEAEASGGPLSPHIRTPSDYALFSFVAAVSQVYGELEAAGRNRLVGTLRDGLNTDRGLRPFQNEIETAIHLIRAGFDVVFWDMEQGDGFDFLAVRDNIELEVECKSVSGDLGKRVHTRRMLDFSRHVRAALTETLDRLNGGRLVRVSVADRLPAQPALLEEMARDVRSALVGIPCRSAAHTIDVQHFELTGTPFESSAALTREAMAQFLETQLGRSDLYAFSDDRRGKAAVVVVVESEHRDGVIGELLRDLKKAAGQFSKSRAAIVVVQFLELEANAFRELARRESENPRNASALQVATHRFLDSPGRSHVHTVLYRSHGVLTQKDLTSIQERGLTYPVTNPRHPHATDKRYRLFPIEQD
jgi:hypothetical protein